MNNFNGGGFKKSAPKFGGKKKFKDDKKYGGGKKHEHRPAGQAAEMFSATCSDCGKSCEVPFRPSSEKPVYCSACFGMKKSANESRGTNHKTEKGSYEHKRPDTQKTSPEHRPSNHNTTRGVGNDVITDLKRQITGLEEKLNRILDLINPPMPSPKKASPERERTVVQEAPKKTVKPAAKVAAKKVVAKKVAPKKAATATAKKVVAKVAKKAATKKVVVKAPAKKVVKKVAKVAPKKAVKKVAKKK
jgi:CxxC-x17-CxxC domain-containing protein